MTVRMLGDKHAWSRCQKLVLLAVPTLMGCEARLAQVVEAQVEGFPQSDRGIQRPRILSYHCLSTNARLFIFTQSPIIGRPSIRGYGAVFLKVGALDQQQQQ